MFKSQKWTWINARFGCKEEMHFHKIMPGGFDAFWNKQVKPK